VNRKTNTIKSEGYFYLVAINVPMHNAMKPRSQHYEVLQIGHIIKLHQNQTPLLLLATVHLLKNVIITIIFTVVVLIIVLFMPSHALLVFSSTTAF
jgi:hypothetical protein